MTDGNGDLNGSGNTIIYIAIRRPDGYVGKPIEDATKVFAMDTGAGSSTIPNFDSGFPVDFAFYRAVATSEEWVTSARLIAKRKLYTNNTDTEVTDNNNIFDSNVGWNNNSNADSGYQSWQWKRHAGFDVVCYDGNGSVQNITHNLSKSPEMIWCKRRNGTNDWAVYHKGQNGGTNPEQYHLHLDSTAEAALTSMWNDTAPTSTQFTVGSNSNTNSNNNQFIAMLFSSVDGISKCGFYDGSDSEQTITTGFQPRFVIIKRTSGARDWVVLDTLRGWGSSSDNWLKLNTNTSQGSYNFGAPTSTGFTLTPESSYVSGSGNEFIYYAHA